jgi:flavin-dependent dehydrogenase
MTDKKVCHNIVIVGGGTAGWMTANLMAQQWKTELANQQLSITLIESPEIGVIGVGEGSTPQLKTFFDKIGVQEQQWMPACNATYKNGILFKNWSQRDGFNSYFHPFTSVIDAHTAPAFVYNTQGRRQGYDIDCHVDRFFLSASLAQQKKVPIANSNFPFDIGYGYHFDAVLLGKFLGKVAVEKGVKHITTTVNKVLQDSHGNIEQLRLENGQTVNADLFVDCTGFASILLQKTLNVPFNSFKENLFNDSAVTIATPYKDNEPLNSQTISTAMKHGWAWDIPLTNRTGNGYVYSSDFCTPQQAEQELRDKLKLTDNTIKANHLKMKVGRVQHHWYQNCVAIGLSQGFIEPLEATALHFVQESIEGFIEAYSLEKQLKEDITDSEHSLAQQQFNTKMNDRFDGIRDYIVAHFRLSDRCDTDYWRRNSENPNISNNLKKIVQCWLNGDDLNKALIQPDMVSFYPPVSWHAILAGYGIFPAVNKKLPYNKIANKYDLAHIDQFITRSATNFIDHKTYLANMTTNKV